MWYNEYDQEIGYPMKDWQGREFPKSVTIKGRYCQIEPLNISLHAEALYRAHQKNGDDKVWTYLPIGPFSDFKSFTESIDHFSKSKYEVHFAIRSNKTGNIVGSFALIRIDSNNGVAEVGYVVFTQELQKTSMSTEANFLLMKYVFDTLNYRRLEWKCDTKNEPSKRAALRLGYRFEGTFHQIVVYKGRNRDTHWFAIIDKDWPMNKKAFEKWLSEDNFVGGKQKSSLSHIRTALER